MTDGDTNHRNRYCLAKQGSDGLPPLEGGGLQEGAGGGFGTRPWWLALLACGGACWPLALEPSAMTSRHPYFCGHPHCCRHPLAWVGIQNATSAMASSPNGLISARYAVITKGGGGSSGQVCTFCVEPVQVISETKTRPFRDVLKCGHSLKLSKVAPLPFICCMHQARAPMQMMDG